MSQRPRKRKLYGARFPSGKILKPKDAPVVLPLEKPPPSPRPVVDPKILRQYVHDLVKSKFVPWKSITPALRDEIMAEPQSVNGKTNPKWLKYRGLMCSGSRTASMTGHNMYDTLSQALEKCLWNTFKGNWRTEWGNLHEPDAAAATLEFFRSKTGQGFLSKFPSTPKTPLKSMRHEERGFVRSQAFPWCGASPDGIMYMDYGSCILRHETEFKCRTKGFSKNAWPEDEWPCEDFYPEIFCPSGHYLPIKMQYYVQIMWCVLIMGKFKLDDVFKTKHPQHFDLFKQFMEPFVAKAKARGIQVHGEEMVDIKVPIIFVVWAPGNIKTPHQGEPEIYRRSCYDPSIQTHRSVMVKTTKGCIQATLVKYDHEFAMKTLQHAFFFWRKLWLPRYAMKQHKILKFKEIDLPANYPQPESETETEDEEEEDNITQESDSFSA